MNTVRAMATLVTGIILSGAVLKVVKIVTGEVVEKAKGEKQ